MTNREIEYYRLRGQIFNYFYESSDYNEAINYVLKLVGEFFHVSRTYIFEDSEDGKYTSNTYEWCEAGITPEIKYLQNISYEKIGYGELFDADGLFVCADATQVNESVRRMLEPQGIKAMVQYLIFDDGKKRGFIGFDDCRQVRPEWYDDKMLQETLITTSRLLSTFLIKERNMERIVAYQQILSEKLLEEKRLRCETMLANQAKSTFVSSVSHDMRTPLNGILGSVELAKEELNNPGNLLDYLDDIAFSGEYLLRLINDVLDVSKLEKGKMELRAEPYSHDACLKNVIKMVKPLSNKKNITLHIKQLNNTAVCLVDKIRYQQIFFNVFSNAVKFTPEGGSITYYCEIEKINEHYIDCKSHIIDTGIGMSPEFQKHVFEPFARERQAGYGERVEGTGLGLHIANQIAHLMGGEVQINSTMGQGTEVVVHTIMQITEDEELPQQVKQAHVRYNINGLSVLVVEDHPINAKIIINMLQKNGGVVHWVNNGAKAVHAFAQAAPGTYDVILMDIRMPVLNGLEASAQIRALEHSEAATIPIIAMTANTSENDIEEYYAAGMNGYLAKPISMAELYAVLVNYLPQK
ncbi:MAG: response regulator [Acidaminococcaceae bacterium]|nr:response regulator [Acidaminococcaceae bacterium]